MCDRCKEDPAPKNMMITVKKRTDQWENEIAEPPDEEIAISYGDRFIPRRFLLPTCERNLKFSAIKPIRDVLRLCTNENYWRENTLIPMINHIAEMIDGRIYSLTDPVVKSTGFIARTQYRDRSNNMGLDWPCKPRAKPCAHSDITFDLPDYDSSCEQNLVDWSSRGQIALSFGHDVIIWQSKVDITMAFNIKCPRSLAYSPSGEFLAIGCKSVGFPALELWDVSCTDDFSVVSGKIFHKKYGDVLCIEWTVSGKQIVSGTRYGTMYILSVPELNTLKKIRKHHLPITIIRFSPNMRYLAAGDAEGNIVVYNWSMCTPYLFVKSRRKLSVVFDWHPWTGVDLAISEDVPASIVLLHVPSKRIVAYYQQNNKKFSINSISFSKVTGELLVSTSVRDGGVCNDFKVLVMSSLDRIVDILRVTDGGARFLTWSPDGTRVATTGSDETLTMWKFCPTKREKYFKRLNGPKEKSSIDAKYGSQFRKWTTLK
ncbi:protein cortex isoform X2 [Stomoxys calcitrans]|uniref:protein cortex isoform X2 n=1 Tax=Stomoxys calcitrans TaxID=35570 RepID=UPI0027E343BD|nr:protein cortex isoform X2 [Stomoxys calcitrans]